MSSQKRIENPYGYFDEMAKEFVITRPDTPTPWMNYLGQGQYGGIISNTAGGYSFDRDPRNRRVTRYRYNAIPVDQPGRYVYLRDKDTGEFWSPTWQPVTSRRLDAYECRHGAGYTRIYSEYRGIAASLLYFVPIGTPDLPPCELWVLTIKNVRATPRWLRSFSYVEFSYFNAEIDLNNLDWGQHILNARQAGGTIYVSTHFQPTVTFFSSSQPPTGFDSDREVFLGRYRDLSKPFVVESGVSQNSEAPRGNLIGSLSHEWVLAPGEEKELVYIIGVTDEQQSIVELLEYYQKPANVQTAFRMLQADWKAYLDHFGVETPDHEMNAMLNFWNPVQCRTTLYWSRFVSAYETGLGRGMGTRDSAQDTLGTVHALPDHARKTLDALWRLQFKDGHTWHQVFPLTGEGGPGLASEFPDWPQWFCDDHLWLIIAVCAYLKETGNLAYLDQRIPYWDGGDDPVWNHILQAVRFTLDNRGPHGLPRHGFSDWDDTMNLDHGSGKAESVWCGMQFCRVMLDLAELCEFLGKRDEANHFRELHREMAQIIDHCAWDGEWFARAFDDAGMPVGVRSEARHQIGLIPQVWALIGETTRVERAQKAMESAHQRLNTPFGLSLLTPAYDGGDPRVRGTSTYPPGAKENGGIFCHANTWAIIAAAKLGWSERAYLYYRQILPLTRQDADRYAVEPYVYCQNICGPEHPQFGYGRNAWLTGTASWTYVAGTQWILGIRPTYQGLKISPVIPEGWKGFHAKRIFRGAVYNIMVERVGKGNEVRLAVDGSPVEGDIIPLPEDEDREVQVKATIY